MRLPPLLLPLLLPGAHAAAFTVAREPGGAWWLRAPDGEPFFFKGVTSVNRGGLMEGRVGPYYNTTLLRYGPAPEAFRAAVTARLRHWGFTGLGAWATPEFFSDAPGALPYTVDLEASKDAPDVVLINGDMPDVFDAQWLSYADARARNVTAATAGAPLNLVGYFTDNELGWPSLCTAFACPPPSPVPLPAAAKGQGLLQQCLSLNSSRPAYAAAWAWLLARHGGSLAALSAAWQLPQPLASRGDLAALYGNSTVDSAGARADDSAWLGPGGYGGAYFNATAAALRRYDPAHLLLGCKFGAPATDSVYAANAAHHDVISVDNYRYDMAARMAAIAAATGGAAPILIAEFSWEGSGCPVAPGADELGCCAPDAPPAVGGFPCAVPGETPAANLTNLDRMYCNGGFSLAEALRLPQVVGWTWYRWVDEGPTDKPPSAYSELGLVDLWDRAKTVAVATIAAVNGAAEALHAAGPAAAAAVVLDPRAAALAVAAPADWLVACPFY